jgi:hypothetical protein
MAKPLLVGKTFFFFLGKFLTFEKTSSSSWLNLYLLAKPLPFDKTFIFFWINLKITFLTKSFNKTFGYLIYLTILLTYLHYQSNFFLIYVHTYLPSHKPTYILIYLPTHPQSPTYPHTYSPTYLSFTRCYCLSMYDIQNMKVLF